MPRSEEQIIAQQGFKLKLGEKDYEIKPMKMRKAQAWRASLSPVLTTILSKDGSLASPDSLRAAIMESPQQMAEAVFSYLGLSAEEQEEILDNATEDQIAGAFSAVMGIAFRPFMGQRTIAKMMLNPEFLESLSASAPPSKLQ
jgi:hypothetical protein